MPTEEDNVLVSTKGRYALRVMVDLTEHQREGYIPLKAIADRQEISEKYLESIIKILVRADLLAGQRGKGGGYRLTRAPEEYTVGEILLLTEGSLSPVANLESDGSNQDSGAILVMWQRLNSLIEDYFDSVTIANLVSGSAPGGNYVI